MNTICDSCRALFAPVVKDRPLRGGGKERRFRCPHCGRWYVVAVFTPAGVKIAQELNLLEAAIRRAPADAALRKRLGELREQLRPEVRRAE